MASTSNMLAGKVCVVTGATRGIGKGIALQLGEQGAIVYITGRTLDPPKDRVGGSLKDTAREIESRGGRCISVRCDHSNDDDIKRLFEQVAKEQDGQLDVLVNSAYSAVDDIFNRMGTKFWDLPISMWDQVNNVGLRNNYICAVYAAKMMVPRRRGLIVNVSSPGGLRYLFNVPYGVGKEAKDRMAADCGFELRKDNVAFISMWPGAVQTEKVQDFLNRDPTEQMRALFQDVESSEYSGQCVVHLAADPEVMKKTGNICLTYDLGVEYGLKDKDGCSPLDICRFKSLLKIEGRTWLAALVPAFVRIPKFLLFQAGNKFS